MRRSSRVIIDGYGFIKALFAFCGFVYMMLYACHVLELKLLDSVVPFFEPFAEYT